MNKFVIVAELRSGYQMLATSLNSNPSIFCFGEIFGSDIHVRRKSLFNQPVKVIKDEEDPILYVKQHLEPYALHKGVDALGFKLNYVCARHDSWKCLWTYISHEEWRVIHLTRRNLLNRMISQKLAEQENNWNNREYKTSITITPEQFLYCYRQSCEWQNKFNEELRTSILPVTYEDMINQPEQTFSKIQMFLGVEPVKLSTNMVKQQTKSQSQVLDNYWELYQFIAQHHSELLRYFEDRLFL